MNTEDLSWAEDLVKNYKELLVFCEKLKCRQLLCSNSSRTCNHKCCLQSTGNVLEEWQKVKFLERQKELVSRLEQQSEEDRREVGVQCGTVEGGEALEEVRAYYETLLVEYKTMLRTAEADAAQHKRELQERTQNIKNETQANGGEEKTSILDETLTNIETCISNERHLKKCVMPRSSSVNGEHLDAQPQVGNNTNSCSGGGPRRCISVQLDLELGATPSAAAVGTEQQHSVVSDALEGRLQEETVKQLHDLSALVLDQGTRLKELEHTPIVKRTANSRGTQTSRRLCGDEEGKALREQLERRIKENCSLNTVVQRQTAVLQQLNAKLERDKRDREMLNEEHLKKTKELEQKLATVKEEKEEMEQKHKAKVRELLLELDEIKMRNSTFQTQLTAVTEAYNKLFGVDSSSCETST